MGRVLLTYPSPTRHGFGQAKKRCVLHASCIDDRSITGNKVSERAMHSVSWVSMKTGVGNSAVLYVMPLKVRERTVII